jgi:hypothetical protein
VRVAVPMKQTASHVVRTRSARISTGGRHAASRGAELTQPQLANLTGVSVTSRDGPLVAVSPLLGARGQGTQRRRRTTALERRIPRPEVAPDPVIMADDAAETTVPAPASVTYNHHLGERRGNDCISAAPPNATPPLARPRAPPGLPVPGARSSRPANRS